MSSSSSSSSSSSPPSPSLSLSSSSSSPIPNPKEIVELWLSQKHTKVQHIPTTHQIHEGLILGPLSVDTVEPGRVVCSLRVPASLTNSSQMLHEGVIASIVDNIGVAAFTSIDGHIRVSVDINVSYVSSAQIDDEIMIEAKILNYANPIGVAVVSLTNKSTGKIIAQGRHTMYYSSKL